MKIRRSTLRLLFLTAIVAILSMGNGYAQDNEIKSLDEILNGPAVKKEEFQGELTSKNLANNYYKRCVKTDLLTMDDYEKEVMCTCMSANMSRTLTVKEFMQLGLENQDGRMARGKALAYAYAPCMSDIAESVAYADCFKSKKISDVMEAADRVCDCAVKAFNEYLYMNGAFIISNAVKHDPLTLNPLEWFFLQGDYKYQIDMNIEQCAFEYKYDRDN